MATVSRDDIAALASRLRAHGRRLDRDLASERADIKLAAMVLKKMVALGIPVLPLEIADDDTEPFERG